MKIKLGTKYLTKNGKEVKILKILKKGKYPVIGEVKLKNGSLNCTCWRRNGQHTQPAWDLEYHPTEGCPVYLRNKDEICGPLKLKSRKYMTKNGKEVILGYAEFDGCNVYGYVIHDNRDPELGAWDVTNGKHSDKPELDLIPIGVDIAPIIFFGVCAALVVFVLYHL